MEKILTEELEKNGFGLTQINQILLAEKDGINLKDYPNKTDIDSFKTLRKLYKKFDITDEDVSAIKYAILNDKSISCLPTNIYVVNSYRTYLTYIDEIGKEKIDEIYNKSLDDKSFKIVCETYCDKNIDLTEYADLNSDILLTFAENKKAFSDLHQLFKKVTKQVLEDKVDNIWDVCDDIKKLYSSLPEKQIPFLNDMDINQFKWTSKLAELGIDFDKMTEMTLELVKSILREHPEKPKHLDKDIAFFKAHKNCDYVTYRILESPVMTNKYFKLFDKNYDKYVYGEMDVLNTFVSSLKGNKIDKKIDFSYFFDINFNYEQKKALLKDINRYNPDKFIKNYVDESFSPQQISCLADALYRGENIKNACNSDFSIEHMRHVIFFNSKGLFFKDDKEYDTKFVEFKNNEYKRFVEVYDDLEKMSYRRVDDIMMNIRFYSKLNTEYNMSIDIDSILHSDIYLESTEVYKILKRAMDHNVDAGMYLNGKFSIDQMDVLETALEKNVKNDELFNPKLSAKKMKEMLNDILYEKEIIESYKNKER